MGDLKFKKKGKGKEKEGGREGGGCLHCLRCVLCCVKGSIDLFPLFFCLILLCVFFSVSASLYSSIPHFIPLTFAAVGTNLAKMEPLPHFFLN